jgi:hypothetical protein
MAYSQAELIAQDAHLAREMALADHRARHPEDIEIPAPVFRAAPVDRRRPRDLGRFVDPVSPAFADGIWKRVEAAGFPVDRPEDRSAA